MKRAAIIRALRAGSTIQLGNSGYHLHQPEGRRGRRVRASQLAQLIGDGAVKRADAGRTRNSETWTLQSEPER
jgi:hypothetical protein